MKVVVVHARYAQPGGEERIIDTQHDVLTRRGHQVFRYEERNDDLPTSVVGSARVAVRSVWSRASQRAVAELIVRERPDVLHVHNHFPAISPSVFAAAKQMGVPTVQHLHNARLTCIQPFLLRDGAPCDSCVGRSPLPGVVHACYRDSRAQSAVAAGVQLSHRALGTWRRRVDRFVAVSEALASTIRRSGVVPHEKLVVCENGVGADPGPRADAADEGYLLYLGRLSPEKGVDLLVDAVRTVPGARLVIAGDGPEMASLRSRAADLDHVRFEGRVGPARVTELLRGARALVAPSRGDEPFGMTVAEAAAVGVPAIVTDAGALPQLVDHDQSGLVVTRSDVAALVNALLRVQDAATAARLGRGARAVFERRFSPASFGDRLESLYASLRQAP